MGLAYMTGDRGGCHQRAFPILYEVGGETWQGQTYERLALDGKAQLLAELQNQLAGLDTFATCDFARYGIMDEQYLEMFAAATGRRMSLEELYVTGRAHLEPDAALQPEGRPDARTTRICRPGSRKSRCRMGRRPGIASPTRISSRCAPTTTRCAAGTSTACPGRRRWRRWGSSIRARLYRIRTAWSS